MNERKKNYIYGLPYKPYSKGVCERVHRAIKIWLLLKKLNNRNKFNISEAIETTINSYNRTIHNIIKAVPNEVFKALKENFKVNQTKH